MCNCREHEYELLPELEAMLGGYSNGYNGYAGAYQKEYEGGAVKAVAASPVFARGFSGPAAECTAALKGAGKTPAQALAIINAQIAVAIKMLRFAASTLKKGSRTKQTNDIFQRLFLVPPGFVPAWLKPSPGISDRGDVVAVRCSRVADLLASKQIQFFCAITTANCPDCDNNNAAFACSSWGDESVAPKNSNVICLGSAFWDAMKNNDTATVLYTLMHEPFHIYFGKYVTEHDTHPGSGRTVGKFGGIACIVQFVFEINGQNVPPLFSKLCSNTVARTAATGF